MIVFVEGVDNTGKTELINELFTQTSDFQKFRRTVKHVDSAHRTYIDGNTDIEMSFTFEAIPASLLLFDFLSQININIIFDRSPFTEYAYGNPNPIFVETLKKWSTINTRMIYCHREDAWLDDHADEYVIASALRKYKELLDCRFFDIPYITLDGRDSLNSRVNKALHFIGERDIYGNRYAP